MRATQSIRAASLLMAAGLTSTAQAVTCYSGVNVFTARGTGEVPPNGLGLSGVHINAILQAVPNSNATVIDYPATFGPTSVPTGVQNANSQIAEYLDACPNSKIVIMGYSQGADVMGLVLEGGDFTVTPSGASQNYTIAPLPEKYVSQVAAIVFFGDPQYNVNIGTNSDAPYPCTVSSDSPRDPAVFGKFGDILQEWCNHDDLFCCATGTSFAGHISYFSQANGTLTGDFVAGKLGLSSGSESSSSASMTTPSAPTMYVTRTTTYPHPSTASSVAISSASKPARASSVSGYKYNSTGATGTVSRGSLSLLPTSTSAPSPAYTITPARGSAASLAIPGSIVLGWLAIARFLL